MPTVICQHCGRPARIVDNHSRIFCSYCRQQEALNNSDVPQLEKLWGIMFDRARMKRTQARANLIPYDLDADYLVQLWIEQDGKCALTGRSLVVGDNLHPNFFNIDRIEPEKGYVRGNVQLVTRQANIAKGPMNVDEFLSFCKEIVATLEPRKNKESGNY